MSLTLAGALAIAGTASSVASAMGVGVDQGDYENINPWTTSFYDQLQSKLSAAESQASSYAGQAGGAIAQARQTGGEMARTEAQLRGVSEPGAMDWFYQDFLPSVPQYQAIAKQTADESVRTYGQTAQQRAAALQSDAMSEAASRYAGQGYSGAAAKAIGEAASAPLSEALEGIAAQRGQSYSNTINSLLNQGQTLAYQGEQAEYQNTLSKLGQILGSEQARMSGQLQAGQTYAGLSGNYASSANQILGQLGNMAGPYYVGEQGSDPLGAVGAGLTGMSGLAEKYNWGGASTANALDEMLKNDPDGVKTWLQKMLNN